MKPFQLVRALRLPFISASVLPFLFGSFIVDVPFNALYCALGLVAVACMHLSANLINDYADSVSGADAQDPKYYGFFGGSKLIQHGELSLRFYYNLALLFAGVSFLSVVLLTLLSGQWMILPLFLLVLVLAWAYSHGPFKLCYNYLGEFTIFLLFGPAVVYGGAFIQQQGWPDWQVLVMSLPCGLLTAAILVANEIPDYQTDRNVRKNTLVGLLGKDGGCALYLFFVSLAMALLGWMFFSGLGQYATLVGLVALPLAIRAALIMRRDFGNRAALVESSKLTILLQTVVSLALIAGVFL